MFCTNINSLFIPSLMILVRYFFSLILVFSLVGLTEISAQANTLIMGKITGNHQTQLIELHVNQQFLDGEINSYQSNILEDGSFMFGAELNENQFIYLDYNRNKAPLYVEPGDTLIVDFEAANFQYSFSFSGKAAGNNKLLYEYLKAYPTETNRFKMVQYRRGTFWYDCDPKMDHMMQDTGPSAFTAKLDLRKESTFDMVDFAIKSNPTKITRGFQDFLEAEAMYLNAYHKLLYGHIYKNKYKLDDSFFTFLDEVPVQNEAIGNFWYRQFLLAYCNHHSENFDVKEKTYTEQYNFANDRLERSAKRFVQSEILVNALRGKTIDQIAGSYRDFILTNEMYHFHQKVINQYDKSIKYMAGSKAPDFTLAEQSGKTVNLNDYKGKVIYLNFWASWCAPCMKKMELMQSLQSGKQNPNVVYVNISLDRKEEAWQKTLKKKNFSGIHLWAEGNIDSKIAKDYQITILPQYYIIDKNGGFAEKPESFDLIEIQNKLSQLSTL